jgi:hypothetical protein
VRDLDPFLDSFFIEGPGIGPMGGVGNESRDVGPLQRALSRWYESQTLPVGLCISQSRLLQVTVFVLVFQTPSSLRVRGRVAAIDLRAQATEMTSHSHRRMTVTKI